jgi:hypothetical protein
MLVINRLKRENAGTVGMAPDTARAHLRPRRAELFRTLNSPRLQCDCGQCSSVFQMWPRDPVRNPNVSRRRCLVRRILKMNSDYGFFHLVNALRSLRNTKNQPAIGQRRSMGEPKLPEIDYSLLRSTLFGPRAGTASI